MLFFRTIGMAIGCLIASTVTFGQSPSDHATVTTFKAAPSYFIANTTQHKTGKKLVEDDEVIAFVQTQQGRVLFTPSGAYIGMAVPADDFTEPIEHRSHKMDPFERGRDLTRPMKTVVMKVGFDAQRAKKRNIAPRLEDKTDHIVSFFLGSQENWQTGLPTYRKLVYENVWDGIDREYLAYQDHLDFQLIVKPGADPSQIVMETGGQSQRALESGELIAQLDAGTLRLGRVSAVQRLDAAKICIDAEYDLRGDGRFTFSLGDFDSNESLIIDPSLTWSTFLGGGGGHLENARFERVFDVCGYSDGSVYITGGTAAADYPTTPGAYDESWNGLNDDVFVTRLDSTGANPIYSTFLGSEIYDYGFDVAVDDENHVFVAGLTYSGGFPTTEGGFLETQNGYGDGFVACFDLTCFPDPFAEVSGDASICLGQSTAVEVFLTGTPPWDLTWSDGFEQLGVQSSPAIRDVSPTVATVYSVTEFSDALCTKTGMGNATVTIDPSARVRGDAYICSGQSTAVQADLTGAPPWNVTWSDGTVYPNVTESPLVHIVSPTVTTAYRVTQVEDAHCLGISSSQARVVVENDFGVGTLPHSSVPQGLAPPVFEAFATCDMPPTEFEWTIPATGYSFGTNQNPITIWSTPNRDTDYQIRVTDSSARATVTQTVRLLVAVDWKYFDLNGDGCNNVADIWALCDDWRSEMPGLNDPNGNGIVEILDFLYLNQDDPVLCP